MTIVSPLTEAELVVIAKIVNDKLGTQFDEARLQKWWFSDPDIAHAFIYETFLALRTKLHKEAANAR